MTQPSDLVLRRVPPARRHLARALAPEVADDGGCTWWELVDIGAAPDLAATGVALTREDAPGVARVVALAPAGAQDVDPVPRLLLELVAALRRTDAAALEVRCGRTDVLDALRGEDVEQVGDVVVVRL
jgi:hypothetical protein